ncbi:hypothetical protein Tco_0708460, partial [Tanacetum coccineum]
MDSEQFSSIPGTKLMNPRTISSGLVPNITSSTPYVPPTKNDWEILFQPMFDEYLNPSPCVDHQVSTVIAPEPAVSTGTPSSTTIDQDAPSSSTSKTTQETPPLVIPLGVEEADHDTEVAHMDNNPFVEFPIPKPSSEESCTQVLWIENKAKTDEDAGFMNLNEKKWSQDLLRWYGDLFRSKLYDWGVKVFDEMSERYFIHAHDQIVSNIVLVNWCVIESVKLCYAQNGRVIVLLNRSVFCLLKQSISKEDGDHKILKSRVLNRGHGNLHLNQYGQLIRPLAAPLLMYYFKKVDLGKLDMERKMELNQALVKMDQDGSADGILQ